MNGSALCWVLELYPRSIFCYNKGMNVLSKMKTVISVIDMIGL